MFFTEMSRYWFLKGRNVKILVSQRAKCQDIGFSKGEMSGYWFLKGRNVKILVLKGRNVKKLHLQRAECQDIGSSKGEELEISTPSNFGFSSDT